MRLESEGETILETRFNWEWSDGFVIKEDKPYTLTVESDPQQGSRIEETFCLLKLNENTVTKQRVRKPEATKVICEYESWEDAVDRINQR